MKKIIVCTLIFVFLSCGSQGNINKPKRLNTFSTKKLLEKGIVQWNPQNKSLGFSWIPYFYLNDKNDFIELYGDFFKLKHPNLDEVNLMVGFENEYGKHKNVLMALVWVNKITEPQIEKLSITAFSSKNGDFELSSVDNYADNEPFNFKRYLLTKKINLVKSREILNKIKNDIITIEVNGYKYELLSPEYNIN